AGPWRVRAAGEKLCRRVRGAEALRETCRQYPLFCCLLLGLSAATLLLSRYLHILMTFWSFVAGVVTFYCSLGPDSLLPNILFTIKHKTKQLELQELYPQGYTCTVCSSVKCNRHRPTFLLQNYQPWLNLKVPSKVDASLSEVNCLASPGVKTNHYHPCFEYQNFAFALFVRINKLWVDPT
uniref:Uncharacterized protein n=1 Tax=Podarcis muralis TaxID=64176 RepID=A0A670JWP8_PODMU